MRQDEASQQLLAELNAWRKEIAAPLERLQADLCGSEKPTGRRFAGAVYRYLQAIRADEAVRGPGNAAGGSGGTRAGRNAPPGCGMC